MRTPIFIILLGFILLCSTVGCKKKEEPKPVAKADTVQFLPKPSPTVSSVVTAKSVDANKNAVGVTSEFKSKETVYAVIKADNIVAGNLLLVKWLYPKTNQVVRTDSLALSQVGSTVSEAHIESKKGLPLGDYRVEVSLNGTLGTASTDFKVVK